ncbi:denn domain-containing protein 4b, partial [Nannochloropsis gaditana CCMP526]|uniref:denn domain-containing protein 4b n=1 Tax=Nannochloropsis gaditana (strain CCMP526) TaxID=1093141 RepID=UPI00029F51A5
MDGTRTYGCVLHLCEEVSTLPHPAKTQAALGRAFQSGNFFVPKALVILSHYPFFNTFREVLLELYRISISSAPLPIERYIANFFCEVPLPPQPTAQEPAAHGSLLLPTPLHLLEPRQHPHHFRHHALLTPIAEALLSLLFPLVWQGAYIPVMPLAMVDILEAPVPFFVGLS